MTGTTKVLNEEWKTAVYYSATVETRSGNFEDSGWWYSLYKVTEAQAKAMVQSELVLGAEGVKKVTFSQFTM